MVDLICSLKFLYFEKIRRKVQSIFSIFSTAWRQYWELANGL